MFTMLSTITDLNDNIEISKSGFTSVDKERRWNTGQHTTWSNSVTTDHHLAGVETRQNTSLERATIHIAVSWLAAAITTTTTVLWLLHRPPI